MITVQERLRRANEFMARRNGIDQSDERYIRHKRNIAYAFEHHIPLDKVYEHKLANRFKIEEDNTMSAEEVEKQIGRPLNNEFAPSKKRTHRKIQNALTLDVYQSMEALAKHLEVTTHAVKKAIAEKKPINNKFYEYV